MEIIKGITVHVEPCSNGLSLCDNELIEEIENKDDITKLKFLIYIFGLLNNNQINDKNEANPDLIDDNDIKIFTLDMAGLSENACTILL